MRFPAQAQKNKKNQPPKKVLIFRETELSSPKIKQFPILSILSPQNFSLKKILIFFSEKPALKNLLYFHKKAFFIFQEAELSYFSRNGAF